jgi:hypothetical protein
MALKDYLNGPAYKARPAQLEAELPQRRSAVQRKLPTDLKSRPAGVGISCRSPTAWEQRDSVVAKFLQLAGVRALGSPSTRMTGSDDPDYIEVGRSE